MQPHVKEEAGLWAKHLVGIAINLLVHLRRSVGLELLGEGDLTSGRL